MSESSAVPSQPGSLPLEKLMHLLLAELESTDPIDFADLPTDENILRQRCIAHVLRQFVNAHDMGLDPQSTVVTLLATCSHLLLENVSLQARLLRTRPDGREVDVDQLLDGIFRKPGRS